MSYIDKSRSCIEEGFIAYWFMGKVIQEVVAQVQVRQQDDRSGDGKDGENFNYQ